MRRIYDITNNRIRDSGNSTRILLDNKNIWDMVMTDSTKLMSDKIELEKKLLDLFTSGAPNYETANDTVKMVAHIDTDRVLEIVLPWHDEQKKLYADAMLTRLEKRMSYLSSLDVHEIIESERQHNGGKT